jgi:hypothetical protein
MTKIQFELVQTNSNLLYYPFTDGASTEAKSSGKL